MNCKPDDLALIVRSDVKNAGKLVTVLRAARPEEFQNFYHRNEGHHWRVRAVGSPIVTTGGLVLIETSLPDCRLRPIRPQADEAQDQVFAPIPTVSTKEVL